MSITLLINSITRRRSEVQDIQVVKTDLNTLADAIDSGTSSNYMAYVAKSANYTATVTDNVILCTGTFTITLPTAVGNGGKVFNIKNVSTGIITVDANGSETIDGDLTVLLYENDNLAIISNNTNWFIL